MKIIYHCDLQTMMLPHLEASRALTGPWLPPALGPQELLQIQFRQAGSVQEKEEVVLRHVMKEHFQDVCSEGKFFTLADVSNASLVPVSHLLQARGSERHSASRSAVVVEQRGDEDKDSDLLKARHLFNIEAFLQPDPGTQWDFSDCADIRIGDDARPCAPLEALGQSAHPQICFRVVKKSAKAWKRVRVAENFIEGFQSRDVLVSKHAVREVAGHALSVNSKADAIGPQSDLAGVLRFPIASSFSQVELLATGWEVKDSKFHVASALLEQVRDPQIAQILVRQMLQQLAIKGSGSHLACQHNDVNHHFCLSQMQELGVVECVENYADSSFWVLCPEWLGKVEVAAALHEPSPIFHYDQNDGKNMLEWSSFRLMSFLHRHHWEMLVSKPRGVKQRDIPCFNPDDPFANRVWYLVRGVPRREYLCALAFATTDSSQLKFRDGESRAIEHFRNNNYYNELLGLKKKGAQKPRRALALDFQQPEPEVKDSAAAMIPIQQARPAPACVKQKPAAPKRRIRRKRKIGEVDNVAERASPVSVPDAACDDSSPGQHPAAEDDVMTSEEVLACLFSDDELASSQGSHLSQYAPSADNVGEHQGHGAFEVSSATANRSQSSSSSDSSSASTSSSSSEADTTEAESDPALSAEAAAIGAAEGAGSPASADDIDEPCEDVQAHGRMIRPETFEWKYFRFTYRAPKGGKPAGYTVTCRRHNPKDCAKCTRSASFRSQDECARVIHRLKAWCVASRRYYNKVDHQRFDKFGTEPLPSLEELESANLGPP